MLEAVSCARSGGFESSPRQRFFLLWRLFQNFFKFLKKFYDFFFTYFNRVSHFCGGKKKKSKNLNISSTWLIWIFEEVPSIRIRKAGLYLNIHLTKIPLQNLQNSIFKKIFKLIKNTWSLTRLSKWLSFGPASQFVQDRILYCFYKQIHFHQFPVPFDASLSIKLYSGYRKWVFPKISSNSGTWG